MVLTKTPVRQFQEVTGLKLGQLQQGTVIAISTLPLWQGHSATSPDAARTIFGVYQDGDTAALEFYPTFKEALSSAEGIVEQG